MEPLCDVFCESQLNQIRIKGHLECRYLVVLWYFIYDELQVFVLVEWEDGCFSVTPRILSLRIKVNVKPGNDQLDYFISFEFHFICNKTNPVITNLFVKH